MNEEQPIESINREAEDAAFESRIKDSEEQAD